MSIITKEKSDKKSNIFGDVNYRSFYPTLTIMQAAAKINHWVESRFNITSQRMENRGDAAELSEYLSKQGFRRIHSNKKWGLHAIVFEGHDHQCLRIVHKSVELQRRPKSPFILQPIATYDADSYIFEVLPKVHTLADLVDEKNHHLREEYGVSRSGDDLQRALAVQLMNDALSKNILFFDVSSENIAVVKNTKRELVPLILDGGSALRIPNSSRFKEEHYDFILTGFRLFNRMLEEKVDENIWEKVTNPFRGINEFNQSLAIPAFAEFIEHYKAQHVVFRHPATYYAAAQMDHMKSLNLTKGAPKKVLTEAQLNSALKEFVAERKSLKHITKDEEQKYDPKKTVWHSALKAGASQSEFGAAINASAKRPRKLFCDRIRTELQKGHGVKLARER